MNFFEILAAILNFAFFSLATTNIFGDFLQVIPYCIWKLPWEIHLCMCFFPEEEFKMTGLCVQSMLWYPFSKIKTFEVKKWRHFGRPFWKRVSIVSIIIYGNISQHIDCNHILISINTNRYNEFLWNFSRHFGFCVFLICHRMYFGGLFTGNTVLHLEASLKNSALYVFFSEEKSKMTGLNHYSNARCGRLYCTAWGATSMAVTIPPLPLTVCVYIVDDLDIPFSSHFHLSIFQYFGRPHSDCSIGNT